MIYWKGVSKAVHEATGNCLSKGECIAIAKSLNATAARQEALEKKEHHTHPRPYRYWAPNH